MDNSYRKISVLGVVLTDIVVYLFPGAILLVGVLTFTSLGQSFLEELSESALGNIVYISIFIILSYAFGHYISRFRYRVNSRLWTHALGSSEYSCCCGLTPLLSRMVKIVRPNIQHNISNVPLQPNGSEIVVEPAEAGYVLPESVLDSIEEFIRNKYQTLNHASYTAAWYYARACFMKNMPDFYYNYYDRWEDLGIFRLNLGTVFLVFCIAIVANPASASAAPFHIPRLLSIPLLLVSVPVLVATIVSEKLNSISRNKAVWLSLHSFELCTPKTLNSGSVSNNIEIYMHHIE
ncbi:MAG: hypothetical protein KAH31_05160 [Candidatus Sabulitectum sp.]|nr:hypothetical protein [Candidatus Sabulitectum sp.]